MNKNKGYTSTLARNGQIVVPKDLRERLGLRAGEVVLFEIDETPAMQPCLRMRRPSVTFSKIVGTLKHLSGNHYKHLLKKIRKEEMK